MMKFTEAQLEVLDTHLALIWLGNLSKYSLKMTYEPI